MIKNKLTLTKTCQFHEIARKHKFEFDAPHLHGKILNKHVMIIRKMKATVHGYDI